MARPAQVKKEDKDAVKKFPGDKAPLIVAGAKKRKRRKSGNPKYKRRAVREIKALAKRTKPMIPHAVYDRICREMANDSALNAGGVRWQDSVGQPMPPSIHGVNPINPIPLLPGHPGGGRRGRGARRGRHEPCKHAHGTVRQGDAHGRPHPGGVGHHDGGEQRALHGARLGRWGRGVAVSLKHTLSGAPEGCGSYRQYAQSPPTSRAQTNS